MKHLGAGFLDVANPEGDLLCGGGVEERAAAAEAAVFFSGVSSWPK